MNLQEAQIAMIKGEKVRNKEFKFEHEYSFDQTLLKFIMHTESTAARATFDHSENGYEIIKEREIIELFETINTYGEVVFCDKDGHTPDFLDERLVAGSIYKETRKRNILKDGRTIKIYADTFEVVK